MVLRLPAGILRTVIESNKRYDLVAFSSTSESVVLAKIASFAELEGDDVGESHFARKDGRTIRY